jgi:hypothetical protein
MASQAQKLRELIVSGEHFIAADAYSALTGRIVERVGFKAAYIGGHACSAFHFTRSRLCAGGCRCAGIPRGERRNDRRAVAGVADYAVRVGPEYPGTAFTLHTGWGWTGAAQLHLLTRPPAPDLPAAALGSDNSCKPSAVRGRVRGHRQCAI